MTIKDLKCPCCGSAIVIDKNEPDGNFMGYSVGCQRYSGRVKKEHRKMSFFGFDTAEQATLFIRQYIEGCKA